MKVRLGFILIVFSLLFLSSCNMLLLSSTETEDPIVCGDGWCHYDEFGAYGENTEYCDTCPQDCGLCEDVLKEKIKKSVVWVKYEAEGFDTDGYFDYFSGTGSGVFVEFYDDTTAVLTNRHVVDCGANNLCYDKILESSKVRLYDGTFAEVTEILFAPHNLDLALLIVDIPKDYGFFESSSAYSTFEGAQVYAAGFPSFGIDDIVEFSIANGSVLSIKELLMPSGFSFNSIQSDAYTYFGSSGGGLFDIQGNLIGINTWLSGDKSSGTIALYNLTLDLDEFDSCDEGSYLSMDGNCYLYALQDSRELCFYTNILLETPLMGSVYYDGEYLGNTLRGCLDISLDIVKEGAYLELIKDTSFGFKPYYWAYGLEDTENYFTNFYI